MEGDSAGEEQQAGEGLPGEELEGEPDGGGDAEDDCEGKGGVTNGQALMDVVESGNKNIELCVIRYAGCTLLGEVRECVTKVARSRSRRFYRDEYASRKYINVNY